jgi:hypothetical protein
MDEKKILTPVGEFESSTFKRKSKFIPIANNNSLESEETNFVFFFGRAQAGKSVILASLLYYMNARVGTVRPKISTPNTREAEVLIYDMLDGLKRGIWPSRTVKDQVMRINLVLDPNNKSKKVKPLCLTFLEMSGENLQEVRRGGDFHRDINEYLNANIAITFFFVTDYENASEDDALMISFLRKLEGERKNFKSVNAILIIAKWDKSGDIRIQSEEHLDKFVQDRMPLTSNQINTYELYKTYYTVGRVIQDERGNEVLEELDLETAGILTEWLYESITGVNLNYEGTWCERLFGK